MARTIQEIKNEMTHAFINNESIQKAYRLQGKRFDEEFSTVSLESILFYIVAVSMWTLEKLYDLHSTEVSQQIATLKPHSLQWYRQKALAFQYGFALKIDSDVFENGTANFEAIENSKIVKYAAVTESSEESRLILKIATETRGKLQPINVQQRESFEAYIGEIKDAGVPITIISYLPDLLRLSMQVYCDPLVIDSTGNSILEGGRPVEEAIQQYMKELPFNGELVLAHLVDKLQSVKGVVIPHVVNAESTWIDNDRYAAYQTIHVKTLPKSGYFEVENFNGITYHNATQDES